MERIAIEKLIKWKDSPRRKPLVIEGARQVGKTWLVKEFAQRNYKQLAYVNFEDMKIPFIKEENGVFETNSLGKCDF